MAELEQLYFSGRPFDTLTVRKNYENLFEHVLGLANSLNALSANRFHKLPDVCSSIDAKITSAIAPRGIDLTGDSIIMLEHLQPEMIAMAGAKAVNLAIMKNILHLPVPEGFIITAAATQHFLQESGLIKPIATRLAQITPGDLAELEAGSAAIRQMVLDSTVSEALALELLNAYDILAQKTHATITIALRSSAVGEDTEASFAGQYATVLNVDRNGIIDAFKRVIASKYSPRALSYRLMLGLEDAETPMCVIGLAMVNAQVSGVMYTADPTMVDSGHMKISSLWGLGEQLVSGNAPADLVLIDKNTCEITGKIIAQKMESLILGSDGGTRLTQTAENHQNVASISDEQAQQLCAFGRRIEDYYKGPQDIEWAIDPAGNIFLLQTRPLQVASKAPENSIDTAGLNNLLITGAGASYGIACGKVHIARDQKNLATIPDHCILITKTAAPVYAEVMGRISGLITEVGSITSHLASVAREFGVPAIFNVGSIAGTFMDGETVTISVAAEVAAYRGMVDSLISQIRPTKKMIVDSPVHRKLRTILEYMSPLNLTRPDAPNFSVEGCQTFHDVIRFCHEHAMREMFGVSATAEGTAPSVKIKTHIPLVVYAIDLGGGLKEGLSSCDTVTADDFESLPMQSIWKGFTHPGISWSGTVNFDASSFMTMMASTATSELGPTPGGDSYALVSRDYMNFSAKFGYHFATIDTLAGAEPNHNYITLQFTGGAGSYFGRTLRVQFLGTVLERLGFQITLNGDLLEASFNRNDQKTTLQALDQLGRLLATSRLLDMAISNQAAIERLVESFFAGDYDFLRPRDPDQPDSFYLNLGHWQRKTEGNTHYVVQNGLEWKGPMSGAISGLIGKALGSSYQEFLDTIGAYYYFPLAIAKNGETGSGRISVAVKPESGSIDRAGGIVFGLRNVANYFVFRINALEDNAILFEFVNNKRIQRKSVSLPVASNVWHDLSVEVAGRIIKCYVAGQLVIEYIAATEVSGHVGLWTKADSVTCFGPLIIEASGGVRTFAC